MKIKRYVLTALLALCCTAPAFAQTTGTITGSVKLFPSSCEQPSSGNLYGTIAIPGTSYAANFNKSGKFTIYNVKPGKYSLSLWAINGNSYSPGGTIAVGGNSTIKSNVVVTAGKSTSVKIVVGDGCCGNGVIETGEVCDRDNFNDKTCATEGFADGSLFCVNNCTEIATNNCSSDPS